MQQKVGSLQLYTQLQHHHYSPLSHVCDHAADNVDDDDAAVVVAVAVAVVVAVVSFAVVVVNFGCMA